MIRAHQTHLTASHPTPFFPMHPHSLTPRYTGQVTFQLKLTLKQVLMKTVRCMLRSGQLWHRTSPVCSEITHPARGDAHTTERSHTTRKHTPPHGRISPPLRRARGEATRCEMKIPGLAGPPGAYPQVPLGPLLVLPAHGGGLSSTHRPQTPG